MFKKALILSFILWFIYISIPFILFGYDTVTSIYSEHIYIYILTWLISFAQSVMIIDMANEF